MNVSNMQMKLADALPGIPVYNLNGKMKIGSRVVSVKAFLNFKYYCYRKGLDPNEAKYLWANGTITDKMIEECLGFDLERYP